MGPPTHRETRVPRSVDPGEFETSIDVAAELKQRAVWEWAPRRRLAAAARVLAAATTVLGVAPLLQDIFWVAMSVTIMAGPTFGTVVTMVAVPVLYATFYDIREQ